MDKKSEVHGPEDSQNVAELEPAIKASWPKKVDEPSQTTPPPTASSSSIPDPIPTNGAQQTTDSSAIGAGTASTSDPHVIPPRDTQGSTIAGRGDRMGNTRQIGDGQQEGSAGSGLEQAAAAQPPPPPAAGGRPMVPDKEDDELEQGAPRPVLLQNYASKDSGAVMLESSPGSKGMANLLVNNRDSYAISPCEEKQWAVFGLSEDIMVRTMKIISHEKYSSLVKDFQVLASQTYPVNEWLDLGTYSAKFVQGEQTFEVPQPAFARYLKFKFLSHYGDEFYCTVTQVKVHGSTMMESFQHEWQQSSAEVREVQDSLMLNKKENVKIATAAAGSSGNGTGATAAAPPLGVDSSSSVSDDNLAPTRVAPTLHSNIATQLATPTPAAVVASASGEGGVGHRPHAASAATVPPLTEKRAVAGGDAGPGELMVEDIVRGVPVEMVVPATPCSGRTEADGTCREGVLGDIADDGRAEAGKAESNVLAAEVPTMGAAGARPNDAGANSISRADVPARSGAGAGGIGAGGVGESVEGSGVGDKRTSEGNVGVDAVGVDKASDGAAGVRGEGRGEQAELGVGGLVEETPGVVGGDEQGHETVAGAIDSNVDGGGGSDVGEASAQPTQGEEAEEPPPRKGIITSTMEAISKAVGGSDGAKKRKSEEDKATDDGNTAGSGASSASTAGMSGSDSPAVGDSVQGDKGLGMDDPRGSASLEVNQGGAPSEISQNAGQVGAVDAPDDSGINPVGVVVLAAVAADVSSHEAPTSACEGAGPGVTVPAGQGLAGDSGSPNGNAVSDTTVNHLYSRHDVMSEAYDHPNKGNDVSAEAVGARGPGGVPPPSRVVVEPGETREGVMASGGANVNANVDVVNGASNTDVQATVTDDSKVGPGMGSKGDSAEVLEGTGYVAGSHAAATASADAAHPASSMRDGHQPGVQVPSVSVSVQTGSGHQHLQPDGQQDQRFAGGGGGGGGDTSVPGQGGESGSPERVVELTDAARAAVCLDRLSFSEFRDEVLARTQQGQQSANGGVAIGGQYDSIFKTLMNKIKTLEINQSLFSLYIDEVHACYQDVIEFILAEQERAQASRLALLSAHSTSLMKMGDQWPGIQELQAKVVEVEKRMLLGSMAWFTSLFCLIAIVSSCCLRACVLFGGGRRGRRVTRGPGTGSGEVGAGGGAAVVAPPPGKEPRTQGGEGNRGGFVNGSGTGDGLNETAAPSGNGLDYSADERQRDCSHQNGLP